MKQTYSIGELAELAGVTTKTLRVYERKGLLLPSRDQGNGYRIYTEDVVRKLEQIQLMKYLGFSLDQIQAFLTQYEQIGREEMLLAQKRLLERKRAQLNSVIACVDKAVLECRENNTDKESFLHALGHIVKNQKADDSAWRLSLYSDEPKGWSEFIFDQAELLEGMDVMDAGAGYGNLWRYNLHRLPKGLRITCVDKHNTRGEDFFAYIKDKIRLGEVGAEQFSFVWEDLELRKNSEKYHCIFFNHVASFIQDRVALYRKFSGSLCENGKFICTWGGRLLLENVSALLTEFLDNDSAVVVWKEKHLTRIQNYEAELSQVFKTVECRTYVTTLRFETPETYIDYLMQVCKPVETELEQRRAELLEFLRDKQNDDGQYTLVRDTYLYCCRNEE